MTTNTGEPANASNTAKKWLSLNGQALANQESSISMLFKHCVRQCDWKKAFCKQCRYINVNVI